MKKLPLLLIPLLCALFCWPLLSHLLSLGRGDWDIFYFYHEVPQVTILTYHQFPLWNPFYCGGLTLIGNPLTRFLSASPLLTGLLGVIPGLKLEIFFHFVIGMVGMFLLSDHLKIRGLLRLLPGIIFIFNGALTLHLTEGALVWQAVVYLPFIFLFLLKSETAIKNIIWAALFLALMIYEGGLYFLGYVIVLLFSFSFLSACQKGSLKFFLRSVEILLGGLLLSGPKLFPVIEWVSLYPRYASVGGNITLVDLFDIFILPFHSISYLPEFTNGYGWWEFGAYIGIAAAFFYMLSFRLFKQHWPLLLSSVLLLMIGLGNFSPFSPWAILHTLPFFRTMQAPSRIFPFFIFTLALLVALFLQHIYESTKSIKKAQWLIFVVIITITIDLFSVNGILFNQALRPFKIKPQQITSIFNSKLFYKNKFTQIKIPEEYNFRWGGWSSMCFTLLENEGVVNGYEPTPLHRNAIPAGHKYYRGEYYLLNRQGEVNQLLWSPNKLVFSLNITGKDRLIVNQNYEKNWKASPARPVGERYGLIAVDVTPKDKQITLYYFPLSFVWGIFSMLFALGIFFLILPLAEKSPARTKGSL